jgi:molecular chaperone GrpE
MAEDFDQDPEESTEEDPSEASADASQAPDSRENRALEELKRERDDYYDRFLRKSAEFDNYRKRIGRERRDQAEQDVTDLLLELLALSDDFERALEVAPGDTDGAYRRGIELIHSKLQDLLRRQNVRPIEAIGQQFDPKLHEAVLHEESSSHREGEVIDELLRGYMKGDRLLRPTMVKVAKA